MKKQKIAFTFVELIVSMVIITILSTIGFYSYIGYVSDARDSERKADLSLIKSALKLYKQKRGAYPVPGDSFNITNSGVTVAYQGKMNTKVSLATLDSLPFDPLTETAYIYSTTKNRQESQIATTLENGNFPIALMDGDYHTVSYEVLPTIILAIEANTGTDVEIHTGATLNGSINRQKFILNKGENLPYSIVTPFSPIYGYTDIDLWTGIIETGKVDFWQNSDYVNCTEIYDAGKYIHETGTESYNIREQSGSLSNTGCTIP